MTGSRSLPAGFIECGSCPCSNTLPCLLLPSAAVSAACVCKRCSGLSVLFCCLCGVMCCCRCLRSCWLPMRAGGGCSSPALGGRGELELMLRQQESLQNWTHSPLHPLSRALGARYGFGVLVVQPSCAAVTFKSLYYPIPQPSFISSKVILILRTAPFFLCIILETKNENRDNPDQITVVALAVLSYVWILDNNGCRISAPNERPCTPSRCQPRAGACQRGPNSSSEAGGHQQQDTGAAAAIQPLGDSLQVRRRAAAAVLPDRPPSRSNCRCVPLLGSQPHRCTTLTRHSPHHMPHTPEMRPRC